METKKSNRKIEKSFQEKKTKSPTVTARNTDAFSRNSKFCNVFPKQTGHIGAKLWRMAKVSQNKRK